MKKHLLRSAALVMGLSLALTASSAATSAAAESPRPVLCTTFPIYQITRNVTQGHQGVQVSLMLPAGLGCPHDYVLTPQDMQKISSAHILVVNGLGMEEFIGAPVKKANPKVVVIESAKGIHDLLEYHEASEVGDPHQEKKHDSHHPQEAGQEKHAHAEQGHKHDEHEHGHPHEGVNPHLFASPRMTGLLAMNIAAELSKADPKGAAVYFKNAQTYKSKMDKLAEELAALGKALKNNRIVTQHGVFDYLARDMGLEVVAVVQAHAGDEPSAAEMLQIVKAVREKKAGAIFTEPQYRVKVGQAIAKEAGIPSAMLDPGATGPAKAGLDYYETVMRKNMEIFRQTLGTK